MNSIWQDDLQQRAAPPLEKSTETEVAVIGGGLAGILTAHLLSSQGKKVIVLEQRSIGSGQTGKTTAKVTAQHGAIYTKLQNTMGAAAAAQYAEANERAISDYRQLIRTRNIRCDWEDTDACLYSTESRDALFAQLQAQKNAGLPAEFCETADLPFPVKGIVRMTGQGQFHPLRFLYALADDLTVSENTRVLSVEKNRIHTENATLDAEQIVFCCHYPFVNFPGEFFLRMHQERSYVLALEAPLPGATHYYSIDTGGLSLRRSGSRVLLGGGSHRTGESPSCNIYDSLRRSASLLFPHHREVAHWSAQDCVTTDSVPYIGRFSTLRPNWYVATGFGKWGMSTSMVAARLIADLIQERDAAWGSVFSPQRGIGFSAFPAFLKDGWKSVSGLSHQWFHFAHSAAKTLAPGQGGIVERNGEKVGIFRENAATAWVVDVRCPHLGCELAWNPTEKSWDCPCHGSRYDYRGQSLNGPAQENIFAYRLTDLS